MPIENSQLLPSQGQLFKPDEDFNIQKLIIYVLRFWWLFVLFITLAFVFTYLVLRYSTPQYKVQAKILVKDTKNGGAISGADVFQDLGLLSGPNSADNEVELLKSRTLMENTVEAEQLFVRYFAKGKVKQSELFITQLPFLLTLINLQQDSLNTAKNVSFIQESNNQFDLKYNSVEGTFKYGDTIRLGFTKLVFTRTNHQSEGSTPINIIINSREDAVANFQRALTVAATSKTVSTIDLTLNDPVPKRGELLVNTLINIYNRMNTDDKNRIADSTISFIDSRLVYVTQELGTVEKDIEQFRRSNELTDLSAQGKLLLENTSDYSKELSKTEVQISIVQSLEKYLTNEQNTSRTIPAGLVIEDPTFASMIEKYNSLQLEKDRQLQTTTESNPVVERLTVQIANLKGDIIANLGTIKRSMEITRGQLKSRTNSFENQIQQVPRKERTFLEFSRQQTIKQELYLYLLKKREETAVSKAANIDNARIVDSAKAERIPFSPNRQLLYLSAFLIGLIAPILILYGRNILNNKIETKGDITSATTAPVVGEIGRSPFLNNLIILEDPRHPVAEQIRLLRTNIDFMLPTTNEGKVIIITSSMSGEGKSFLSLNLAALLAFGEKKVILLEFDLRKPKLSKYLNFENNSGITNFLIKKTLDIHALTRSVPGINNLDFLSSGAIPPNPSELINNLQATALFDELKKTYEYIVVDVPPVGIVTDALLLARYADISLYIVRQKYSYKNQLELINEVYLQNKLPNVGIVVNDVRKTQGYGYGYGYGNYGQEKVIKKI